VSFLQRSIRAIYRSVFFVSIVNLLARL